MSRLILGLAAALAALGLLIAARSIRRAWRRRREDRLLAQSRQPDLHAELEGLLAVETPLPELGGWAITPDLGLLLARHVLAARPAHVLEFGSGASTVVLAEALRRTGGSLVSLEHDPAHARATRSMLESRGLQAVATVLGAALVPDAESPRGSGGFYDLSPLARLPEGSRLAWDLVLVDGPPATGHPQARRPALPRVLDRLAPGGLLVLDDGVRPGEKAIVEHWRSRGLLEGLSVEPTGLLRGAILLRRRAPSVAAST